MKAIRFISLGAAVIAIAMSSSAKTTGDSTRIAQLETQIEHTVKGTPSTAIDKAAIRRLNELKITLMNLLNEQIAQLHKDAANNSLSSAAKKAILIGMNADHAEIISLNNSLGTWRVGLPETSSTRSAAQKTKATAAAPAACPNPTIDPDIKGTLTLNAIDPGSRLVAGKAELAQGPKGKLQVQVCVDKKSVGIGGPDPATGKFTVTLNTNLNVRQKVRAQLIVTTAGKSVYSQPSNEVDVGSCHISRKVASASGLAKPTLTSSGNNAQASYSVTLPTGKGGEVRICVNDFQSTTGKVPPKGPFTTALKDVKPGDVVVAQEISGDSPHKKYGPTSTEVGVGKCSAVGTASPGTTPTLETPLPARNQIVIKGSAPDQQSKSVRICVGDYQTKVIPTNKDGSFEAVINNPQQKAVTAQLITSRKGHFPRTYGAPSKEAYPKYLYSDKLTASFVGGVEQSGFSSKINNTYGFLNAFFQTPFYGTPSREVEPAIWGRIRLLSGALPSTTNVEAAVTDPSGTITSKSLTNVGQVVDYSLGPLLRLMQHDHPDGTAERISLFADVGATTPLSSNNIQYSLQAPLDNSQQCFQLIALYPDYLANGGTAPACTLINKDTKQDVKTLAFAPMDRTNFFLKYAVGFRFTHFYPAKDKQAPYAGSLDVSIGQDESITGGRLHGAVFRIDGLFPLAFGASSYLYLFGSASMKLTGNVTSNPVVLATAQNPALPLPTSVALLPLAQPNRDFYRFGVGLNITAIFCKLKTEGCAQANAKTTPASTNKK